ncbi:hypothetical protein H7J86_32850 [Mycobacterium hackensackense]|uniref:hypothetical protein n=1 Tax=Mycobacterium hackensackense TaxID=228909 RepID=UPI002265C6B0|nr:hypothetical protein [Mycobacterium hackensackense]MCV7256975.1 hypothetical protein [Mycobacterium hackensackense]
MDDDDTPAVLLPVTTERVDPWEPAENGGRFRYFQSTPRGEDATVRLAGFQRADGTLYDLAINVDAEEPLGLAAAEQLIKDLGAALEDLRRLSR